MENYQCKKCSIIQISYGIPNNFGCLNADLHHWFNLGEVGPNKFQCRKCGLIVKSWNNPNSNYCPSNGSHKWQQLWNSSHISASANSKQY